MKFENMGDQRVKTNIVNTIVLNVRRLPWPWANNLGLGWIQAVSTEETLRNLDARSLAHLRDLRSRVAGTYLDMEEQ